LLRPCSSHRVWRSVWEDRIYIVIAVDASPGNPLDKETVERVKKIALSENRLLQIFDRKGP
jgi:hypothetical protein